MEVFWVVQFYGNERDTYNEAKETLRRLARSEELKS